MKFPSFIRIPFRKLVHFASHSSFKLLLCLWQTLPEAKFIHSIKCKNNNFSLLNFWWLEQISSLGSEPICPKLCRSFGAWKFYSNRPSGSKVMRCQTQKILNFAKFSRVNNSVESGNFEKVPNQMLLLLIVFALR